MTLIDRNQRIESVMRQAVHYRNYRRARDRALVRLSQAYPETYKELLELEKVNDETTNAKWVDIDGSVKLVVVAGSKGRERGVIIGSASPFGEDEGDNE
jgi:hypothetical protein